MYYRWCHWKGIQILTTSFTVECNFIEAAIHRSGNSSKRQFIKAAIHWTAFSSNAQAQIRWACAFDEKASWWIVASMKCRFTQFHIIKGNKLLKLAIFAITKCFYNFMVVKSLTQLRYPTNFFFRIFILFTSST